MGHVPDLPRPRTTISEYFMSASIQCWRCTFHTPMSNCHHETYMHRFVMSSADCVCEWCSASLVVIYVDLTPYLNIMHQIIIIIHLQQWFSNCALRESPRWRRHLLQKYRHAPLTSLQTHTDTCYESLEARDFTIPCTSQHTLEGKEHLKHLLASLPSQAPLSVVKQHKPRI